MRDTDIATRLRNAGLKVVEVDGWRTRGSASFAPRGAVHHHTVGSAAGNAPSLGICINGRADLPGPLCNVLIARDNTCYVIAAGRANHAGPGGWEGLSGNSSVYGVEHENIGTTREPWRPDQLDAAARCLAALVQDRASSKFVCQHKEWAPDRKGDCHSITGAEMRARVDRVLDPTEVCPMFDPPLTLEPIVAELKHPEGGVALLAASGAVYAFDCPHQGGANGKAYFAGRKAALLEPNPQPGEGRPWYVIRTTSGEVYGLTGF